MLPAKRLFQTSGDTLLRFLTCGSVDDGKSTLIGRLLLDTKSILADTLHAIERTSRRRGAPAAPARSWRPGRAGPAAAPPVPGPPGRRRAADPPA